MNARHVDSWWAYEKIDESTFIVGEPHSPQYNLCYLIAGTREAILFDTGSSSTNASSHTIRTLAETLTDRPFRVVLSHFHFDHTGGVEHFSGLTMLDLPQVRSRTRNDRYRVRLAESMHPRRPVLPINQWVAPGSYIDLGNRSIQVINTPGHAPESITLIDPDRKYAFTGDFHYQHLGGIFVAFPGGNLIAYEKSAENLLAITDQKYRFFGAHGLPEFDRCWVEELGEAFTAIQSGRADLPISASTLAPWLPLRLYAKKEILVYLKPFFRQASQCAQSVS